jgi:DNA-binding transcriptional MocR family regulator
LFSISDKFESCLRLNGDNPWSELIDQAIAKLGALVHEEQVNKIGV